MLDIIAQSFVPSKDNVQDAFGLPAMVVIGFLVVSLLFVGKLYLSEKKAKEDQLEKRITESATVRDNILEPVKNVFDQNKSIQETIDKQYRFFKDELPSIIKREQ